MLVGSSRKPPVQVVQRRVRPVSEFLFVHRVNISIPWG
jgi:hypothetical protein